MLRQAKERERYLLSIHIRRRIKDNTAKRISNSVRITFPSRHGQGMFLLSSKWRPALGLTQSPIQWVLGALSPPVKRPRLAANHSPPINTEWNYTAIPPHMFPWHALGQLYFTFVYSLLTWNRVLLSMLPSSTPQELLLLPSAEPFSAIFYCVLRYTVILPLKYFHVWNFKTITQSSYNTRYRFSLRYEDNNTRAGFCRMYTQLT